MAEKIREITVGSVQARQLFERVRRNEKMGVARRLGRSSRAKMRLLRTSILCILMLTMEILDVPWKAADMWLHMNKVRMNVVR